MKEQTSCQPPGKSNIYDCIMNSSVTDMETHIAWTKAQQHMIKRLTSSLLLSLSVYTSLHFLFYLSSSLSSPLSLSPLTFVVSIQYVCVRVSPPPTAIGLSGVMKERNHQNSHRPTTDRSPSKHTVIIWLITFYFPLSSPHENTDGFQNDNYQEGAV